jgi:hypothetical protein
VVVPYLSCLRFRPGQPLTPSSFDPFATPFATPWLGDYQGLAVGAGTIHPVWNGTTRGDHMELFTPALYNPSDAYGVVKRSLPTQL